MIESIETLTGTINAAVDEFDPTVPRHVKDITQEDIDRWNAHDYEDAVNKPQINGVELTQNKTLDELGIQEKEPGKGLSTNDLTDELKNKYDEAAMKVEGLHNYDDTEIKNQIAQAGKIDTIKVNGAAQEVIDKTVELTIPTNTNQLENGAGYITANDINSVIDDQIEDYFDKNKDQFKGETGPQGEQGIPGKDGEQGPQGEPGLPGENGKDFTYDMFTSEQLEALKGPQGEPGSAGEDGKSLEFNWDGTKLGIKQEGQEEYEYAELSPTIDVEPVSTEGFLRNQGHFDDLESLPDIGQPSGEVGEHPSVLEVDYTNTNLEVKLEDLPNLTTLNGVYTPYVFGFYVDKENYFFVSTDNPELIDGFSYSLDGSYHIYTNLGENIEKNFVVPHACYKGMYAQGLPPSDPDGYALMIPEGHLPYFLEGDFMAGTGHPPIMGVTEPALFMHYLGNEKPVKIFGNLPTKIKYKEHIKYTFEKTTWEMPIELGWELISEDAARDSLTLAFKNNYTYTEGMEALRFDEQGNAYWITDDGAKENDIALIGELNDPYIVDDNLEWVPMSKRQDTSNFLRQIGHVDSIEDLPNTSQPSGEVGQYPSTFEIDPTKVDVQLPDIFNLTTFPEGKPLPYVVGAYLNEDNFIYVATDTPEYIESFSYGLDGSYCFRFPLTVYQLEDGSLMRANVSGCYRYNGIDGEIPDFTNGFLTVFDDQLSDPNLQMMHCFRIPGMNDDGPATIFGYIGGNGQAKIFGNLPTTLKYKNHLEFSGKKISGASDGFEKLTNATSDSLTLAFADNYTYTDGMDILRFDENYNAYWITDEGGAKENDVATVGEKNDIYVVNENNEWEKWNKLDEDRIKAIVEESLPTDDGSDVDGEMYKIYKIAFSKPANAGGTTDVSGSGNAVKNAIMEAAAEGKLPLIYNSNYYGFFTPIFSLEDVKTATQFAFAGPAYSQYNSSNTGQVGTAYVYFKMKSNDNGVLEYNANSIGAGQLMLMNQTRFLSTYNTKEYTPTENYHPATKKYVDDMKNEVVDLVIAALPNGNEVSY